MALNTNKALRNQVMYQVFVRNYSKEGTFEKVREDLGRMKALGVDIIWLMPIHPIGKVKRKGTLGSPYAISDYRAVNPEFGTLDDFKRLVDAIHENGMKCIIDVVYNHTSPDSVLAAEHPEWFYRKADGSFGNRVGDWSDIIDLDYGNEALWDYQIETLKYWAEIVDGFRCDVAPLVPIAFWEKARNEVAKVRENCIWLSESVEPGFITAMREQGYFAASDGEMYRAFDICYDYDIADEYNALFNADGTLQDYAAAVNRQEYIYPENYVKLRFLENHDRPRAHRLIPDERSLVNWTAFLFFQKGLTLLYNGQEFGATHLPSLFDRDTILMQPENGPDLSPLIAKLSAIKHSPVFTDSSYRVTAVDDGCLTAFHKGIVSCAYGIFALDGKPHTIKTDLLPGIYPNAITNDSIEVSNGEIQCDGTPIIIL